VARSALRIFKDDAARGKVAEPRHSEQTRKRSGAGFPARRRRVIRHDGHFGSVAAETAERGRDEGQRTVCILPRQGNDVSAVDDRRERSFDARQDTHAAIPLTSLEHPPEIWGSKEGLDGASYRPLSADFWDSQSCMSVFLQSDIFTSC
jgi:hypothetical protein